MAFHTLNINNNLFELAPFKVKTPVTEANANYFIPFLSGNPGIAMVDKVTGSKDFNPSNIYIAGNRLTGVGGKFYYNPSSNILTVGNVKITGTNSSTATIKADAATNMYVDIGGNTPLVIKYDNTEKFVAPGSSFSNLVNLGTSARKWANVYATTFHGSLDGTASKIKVKLQSLSKATYYIPFVDNTSGNQDLLADTGLKYNSSKNILTTTQVNANLNGAVQTTATSTSASYYISFVNASATGMRYSYVNSSLYYNPSTTTLTAPKIKYTSTAQQWIGGKTLTNNAFYPSNNFTTTAFFPILAAKTSGENVISLGGLGDQYGFFGYKKDTTENKTDWHFKWDSNNGNTYVTGKIYGTATHADNINVSAATANATYYVSFVNGTSGARIPYTDAGLYYNPSTNELSAGGGFYERSDERLKDFQEDIEVNFSYLHNIPKKYYSWKDDATYVRHIGTSAQEVQKYYPELVNTDDNGYLTMNYDKLSVVALKAIDILHEEVTELKKENAELKERLARLEELILNK